jgi:replicative DNA helicase
MKDQKITMPAAQDIEAAVVGALLVDSRAALEAMPLLKSSDLFFNNKLRLIFEAITGLYDNNRAIDILTVSERLKQNKTLDAAGGDLELIQLTQKISSGAHIEYHARLLMQYWIKRRLIRKADLIKQQAFQADADALELLEVDARINDEIGELITRGSKEITYKEALAQVEKRVELISSQKEGEFTGIPTGFGNLDKFTGGWQPSDLVIIAARPGMGKTAFILKDVVECGLQNIPCGIFSLEMSATQLAARTVAINSNFHLSQLIRDGFKKDKYFVNLRSRTVEMGKYPIYIDDTPAQDIRDIITQARKWKRKHGIKILFVDYIQLVTDKTKANNREQEIASISRNLKKLAKELDLPVIALSQLSRQVETRMDKHPKLSDLRESGAIEQDADMVCFLYREHYYNPDAILPDWMQESGANAEFNIAKFRSGSLETRGLYFDANKVKYMDPADIMPGDNNEPF